MISVGTPSQLVVAPSLTYTTNGKERSVVLAPLGLHIATARNQRIPLPPKLRGALPPGTKVELTMRISATANSAPRCDPAAVTVRHSKVKVVRILAAAQPGVTYSK